MNGYRAPIYGIVSEDEKRAKSANDQNEMKRADYALEEWARWCVSAHGYNRVCSIARIDESQCEFAASLPNGVDNSDEVGNVIRVLAEMDIKRSNMIRKVSLFRKRNISISEFIKGSDIYRRSFNRAKKDFAQRLEALT